MGFRLGFRLSLLSFMIGGLQPAVHSALGPSDRSGRKQSLLQKRALKEILPIGFCNSILHSPMYGVEWVSGESASAEFRMVRGSLQRIPDDGPSSQRKVASFNPGKYANCSVLYDLPLW